MDQSRRRKKAKIKQTKNHPHKATCSVPKRGQESLQIPTVLKELKPLEGGSELLREACGIKWNT